MIACISERDVLIHLRRVRNLCECFDHKQSIETTQVKQKKDDETDSSTKSAITQRYND